MQANIISSENSSEPGLSRRERCAWINLTTTSLVYVPYFTYLGWLLWHGDFHFSAVFGPFLAAVVAQIVLSIIVFSVFALKDRSEPKDERDIALESRSLRAAYRVLAVMGFILLVLGPAFFGRPVVMHGDPSFVLELTAQLFLLCFVAAEAVRFAVLAVGYRRGF